MVEKPVYPKNGRTLSAAEIDCNFEDLHRPLSAAQAMGAADSCIYCYNAPCVTACPTSIDIPTFIHQIKTGNVNGAAETILSENILGGTCARACPTEILCEQACVRNLNDEPPVQIGSLQRFAVDHLMDQQGAHPFQRAQSSGRTIAVLGAGPAGLACAHRASMLGHDVTIFEAKPKSGGLNEYGLAAYKMVDDFAQREVEFLMGIGGISVRHGQQLGGNLALSDLTDNFDAVFLGVGFTKANPLPLPGCDLQGVENAIDFIASLRQAEKKSSVAVGNNVVVIGGGNTAIDAAIQAKRLGGNSVTLVYRRGEANMSATAWEIELARTNGVVIRLWAAPVAIEGSARAEQMTFNTMSDAGGTYQPTGESFTLPADHVLLAIGQSMNKSGLENLTIDGGKIAVDATGMTSMPGVFAGGDCVKSGDDLTVQAVEDGKQAAIAIDQFLRNKKG
ncbi:NAD(P)-dependent oxidoreductase [Simiduia aestuariiviva]|uniref:Glutamate synthase (NADPH/NADH) small chain n=1 Tax=Simiduia aestuariiviva TaxID=1510459 RepID=A0A839UP94_9GAMM|nr:NAD(P)-dependent oxidoreductase [Simiduia aestuariiviva]MBB3167378.1 glutamate synthase (NADPH/NADH) small chain [Simiduia aestuariiviva]